MAESVASPQTLLRFIRYDSSIMIEEINKNLNEDGSDDSCDTIDTFHGMTDSLHSTCSRRIQRTSLSLFFMPMWKLSFAQIMNRRLQYSMQEIAFIKNQ